MVEVFKIFILSTIIITLWTAFLLLQDKRGIPQLNRWFAVFLFALTTPQMDLYASHFTPGGVFVLSVITNTFIWLKGPFIWIFLAVLTRKNISPQIIGIHFVPWLIALLTILAYRQLAPSIVMLGMCQALGYLCAAVWRLIKKRSYIAEVWQGFQNTAYYWLLYILGGLIVLVAIDLIVLLFVQLSILKTYNLLDYCAFPIFSIYVMSIGILCVYRPELLFRDSSELDHTDATDLEETSLDQKRRNCRTGIGSGINKSYARRTVVSPKRIITTRFGSIIGN